MLSSAGEYPICETVVTFSSKDKNLHDSYFVRNADHYQENELYSEFSEIYMRRGKPSAFMNLHPFGGREREIEAGMQRLFY